MISNHNSSLARELYEGAEIRIFDMNRSMGRYEGHANSANEIKPLYSKGGNTFGEEVRITQVDMNVNRPFTPEERQKFFAMIPKPTGLPKKAEGDWIEFFEV